MFKSAKSPEPHPNGTHTTSGLPNKDGIPQTREQEYRESQNGAVNSEGESRLAPCPALWSLDCSEGERPSQGMPS